MTMECNIPTLLTFGGMIFGMVLCISAFLAALLDSMDDEKKADRELNISTISLAVCLISMILIFVGWYRADKSIWNVDKTPYATENIIALNDNNLTQGRFYLRRGYFEESLYYQYIVNIGDGGMINNKVAAQTATIYYDNDNPKVEWYHREKHWLWFKYNSVCHKIYIPTGSINEEFNVDLK